MDIGDRVMVTKGVHGGMVGTLHGVRVRMVRMGKQGRAGAMIEKPVGTIQFTKTNRTIEEVMSNLRPVPVYPFA